jgi:hypothetical protein
MGSGWRGLKRHAKMLAAVRDSWTAPNFRQKPHWSPAAFADQFPGSGTPDVLKYEQRKLSCLGRKSISKHPSELRIS